MTNDFILGVQVCDGDNDCCNESNLCHAGEGDCDNDSDCYGHLTCGTDNCMGWTFSLNDDCCEGKYKIV